ncbi:MAG: hypothetical protein Q9220_005740 [cf. Caloplaca sp. 1 TL-2023]
MTVHCEPESTAHVATINLSSLKFGDAAEASRLFDACCDSGFFYLDLSTVNPDLSKVVENIYRLEEDLFRLPEEILMKFDIDRLSPTSKVNGGEKDFPRPNLIDGYISALRTFTLAINTAIIIILESLSRSIKLAPSSAFETIHHTHRSSPHLIRLLKYHPQPPSEQGSSHIPHTDLGSLTFLFTRQPGLQIQSPQTGSWQWVTPPSRATTAIVNLGDCMSMLTGGLFRSSKHRVIGIEGKGLEERYSFAYFLRPDEDAVLAPVESPLLAAKDKREGKNYNGEAPTCRDWLQKKYQVLRRQTWNHEQDWILSGAT